MHGAQSHHLVYTEGLCREGIPSRAPSFMAANPASVGLQLLGRCLTASLSGPSGVKCSAFCRHIDFLRGVAYMVVQITGGIFGSLLVAGLVPGSYIGEARSLGNSHEVCKVPLLQSAPCT